MQIGIFKDIYMIILLLNLVFDKSSLLILKFGTTLNAFFITPSFGAGFYDDGSGKKLGNLCNLELLSK